MWKETDKIWKQKKCGKKQNMEKREKCGKIKCGKKETKCGREQKEMCKESDKTTCSPDMEDVKPQKIAASGKG